MSDTICGGGLQRGRVSEWLNKIKKALCLKASVYVPVADKKMARTLKQIAEENGLRAIVRCEISKGRQRMPYSSRRVMWLEVRG